MYVGDGAIAPLWMYCGAGFRSVDRIECRGESSARQPIVQSLAHIYMHVHIYIYVYVNAYK